VASVFTAAGSGALAAGGSPPAGPTIAAVAGAGVAAWGGSGTAVAALVSAGGGALAGVAAGSPPGVLAATGAGAIAGVGRSTAAATATMAGSGALSGVLFTKNAAGALRSAGTFSAAGSWQNLLPFNYSASWSIPINGATIAFVAYDPVSRNLRAYYAASPTQFVVVQGVSFNVTTAIQFAPNPEAYVLGLIG
jgi:hypothetical protein